MTNDSTPSQPRPRRRWIKRTLIFILVVVVVALVADFGYSRYIAHRISKWEASIERDEKGVQVGCQAFEMGDKRRPTALLLVHGLNDSPSCYRLIAPALAEKGYFCRAMRLPGFAEATEIYSSYSAPDWIESVRAELQQLKRDHQHVFIIAHSLGGATAISLLLQDEGVSDGLILLAPAIETSDARSPLFSARFYHRLSGAVLNFTSVVESPYGNDCADPEFRNPPGKIRFVHRNTIDQLYRLIDTNRGQASRLSLPVMMVLPGEDIIVDNEASKKFFEQLGSANKLLKVQSRARHSLPYDLGWEEVVDWIDQFVASQSQSP